ncbi:MAG TPA: HNH endonuclease [Puia sp.]|nr:HNH endonuclease [Puia sp.]
MAKNKLEPENAPLAFKIACEVYAKRMKGTEGRRWLAAHAGFNESTAADLIADFKYLMTGRSFARTLGNYYATYFLQHIYEVFGRESLATALRSFAAHIEYYERQSGTNRHGLRAIYDRFMALLTSDKEDLIEQGVFEYEIAAKGVSKDELVAKIRSLEDKTEEFVAVSGLRLKRKNWIIVLIKELRDHKCQLCGAQIRTKTGRYYVEAAHIDPKAKGGAETLDNILLLCPNHHKEFDLGEVEMGVREDGKLKISINGVGYEVSFENTGSSAPSELVELA